MAVKLTALTIVGAVFLSNSAIAQAPVRDLTAGLENQQAAQETAVRNNVLEIQTLREEISSLRGLVEELNYELGKIKQRQDEDYQDLDRRITSAGTGSTSAPVSASSGSAGSSASSQDQSQADQLYRTGFNALREGDRASAIKIFDDLVAKYPGSSRDADALYWLGETHWLNLDYENSREAFVKLYETYPNYRKLSEVQYRLGQVYSQLGDQDKALEFIQAFSESGGE